VFDELKPTELISMLRPSIVVKGGEWLAEQVRVQDEIPSDVEIKIFPVVKGYSSEQHHREDQGWRVRLDRSVEALSSIGALKGPGFSRADKIAKSTRA